MGMASSRFDFPGGLFDLWGFALLFFEELVAAFGDGFGFLFRGAAGNGESGEYACCQEQAPDRRGASARRAILIGVTQIKDRVARTPEASRTMAPLA